MSYQNQPNPRNADLVFFRWALLWSSENKLDGYLEHIISRDGQILYFNTREEARIYKEKTFGYIKNRPDLKEEPHGWKIPKVIKVRIAVEKA